MIESLPEYRVIRSRRKTLELRLYPDRRLEVRAPHRTREADIHAFVASRRDWIARRLRAMPEPQPAPRHCEGTGHLFQGRRLPLRLETGRHRVCFEPDAIRVRLPDPRNEAAVERTLERGLRREAYTLFERMIDDHFPWFADRRHPRPTLRVKAMKTRWGSLSTRGYINLNLALVRVAPECAEYVVVHELCHLEHAHHGPAFQRLMDERLPDWRRRRARLNAEPLQ